MQVFPFKFARFFASVKRIGLAPGGMGRDEGEIRKISHSLLPQCLKEFQPEKGEKNRFFATINSKNCPKPKDDEHSDKFYNYPYQALEEAVVNSLYHRDWTIREPVEITIEPDRISILNFSGPNHTIPMEAVREGKSLRSRRYRNRRLGEFLKELDLTEGRATGIPTIQDELKANGSPRATIETDEERTYFLIDIPCHPEFVKETLSVEQIGVKGGVKELSDIQEVIVKEMLFDPSVTTSEMAQKTGIKFRTLQRHISQLQEMGIVVRKDGRKDGYWEVVKNK